MSTLIVEVCAIEEVKSHPNADRLEMIRVKNWWCISGIGTYKVGDKVVYVPPDSILSKELAERWGIAKYCAMLPKECNGERPDSLRVRACRLRGERSFGTIQTPDEDWEVGHDVKEHYGIEKYEPPLKIGAGDAARPVEGFHVYTDIENIGNFPGIFQDGEEVVVDEKIHGTNCRIGVMLHPREPTGEFVPTFMAGSHGLRRKRTDEKGTASLYWHPYNGNIEDLLLEVFYANDKKPVIIFGEIFGPGIQDMHYGQGTKAFRAFDIAIDGRYMDCDNKSAILQKHNIPQVPFIYRGPFSMEKMDELVDGPTMVCESGDIKQPFKGREGIVIRPAKERYDENIGRVILKCVSVDYHERKNKNATEDH
jgi:RNA ligase (TIGR02306 family)